jgi:hypothetical protein
LPSGAFRRHVFLVCSGGLPRIFFASIEGEGRTFADEALSGAAAAEIADKTLIVLYDPSDTSDDQVYCKLPICARMLSIDFKNGAGPNG